MKIELNFNTPTFDNILGYLRNNGWKLAEVKEGGERWWYPARNFDVFIRSDKISNGFTRMYELKQINYADKKSLLELWSEIEQIPYQELLEIPLGGLLVEDSEA